MRKQIVGLGALALAVLLLLAVILPLLLNAPTIHAAAGPLLDENFDYVGTAGNLTVVSGGNWTAHSGAGSNPVGYAITSLSMPGYGSSGVGGSATFISGSGSREDVNRTFTTQNSGIVYYAALVKVSSASSNGEYCLHLKDTGTSNYMARLYARDVSGKLRFGLSADSSPASYGATDFSYNTTYLVVVKYNIGTRASALYVSDAYMDAEPGTALVTSTPGGAPILISAIAIRQGSVSLAGTVDGIRVATTWADAVGRGSAFSIAKSASTTKVQTGDLLTYTIRVKNTGVGGTATNVVITDALPTDTSWAWGGTYDEGTLTFTTPSTIAVGGTISVTFGVTVNASPGSSVVNETYGVYCTEVPTPTLGKPVAVTVVPNTPPTVVGRSPAPDAVDAPLNTNVVVTFSQEMDPATVVPANFTLTGPYGVVPWDAVTYDQVAYRATLNPHGLLLPTSRYTVTIDAGVTDWVGRPVVAADRTWSFTTQAELAMLAFLGDLHNHTSYSDGSGMPVEAFASAKSCGLDFLAVTDHSYALGDGEWADVLNQANLATDSSFVGLRGFEYTQGAEGHANVYNTVRHATRSLVPGCVYCDYTPNLEKGVTVQGFYPWLAITGTHALDGAGTVMQFNHPGWINFNDWAYHPEVEDVAELEEIGNGWDTSYTFSWDEWLRSLDYGWRVGATNNSDNHAVNWGCISPHRTGVVMPSLTKADLLDALRARRTYATEDSSYELFFKANGSWMGSEIANTGQIAVEVWGGDPDTAEATTLVQLVTTEGQVVTETQPNTASFAWNFNLAISSGVHYYFVLAIQADGDRIVTSPVWTMGTDDVRLTDLSIQPTIPTIYNPSLLNARVTNRGATTQTVTVAFRANGALVGQVPVTVNPCSTGPCSDGYATVSWQPVVTGPVTVTATIGGAPAGDNSDDNSRTLHLDVTDEKIPLILIDAGHNNVGVDPHGISQFLGDLTLHGYNVLFNLDAIAASDLNTETVKLLILNAYGPSQLTAAERQAIANFVKAGGSLWLNGMSDYAGTVAWANTLADRMNELVGSIETTVGQNVPIRFNDDEVLDGDDNNGYPWGILWHTFPVSNTTGVGMNVLKIQSWSVASLVDRNKQALTESDLGDNGFLMTVGDLDTGNGTYGEANRTHSTDADNGNDAFLYNKNPPYMLVPAGAGYQLSGQAGRLFFYGDSNDPFNIFAYVAGDGKQNELFNLEVVMWLLGKPLLKQTVAQARAGGDTPVNLNRLVWVEGVVTAGYGEFFDVLYTQDDTGGITVFAPAGTASGAVETAFKRGDCVRVVGTVDRYQGDTEIQFFETEQVQVLAPSCIPSSSLSIDGSVPRPLSTYDAAQEENEGWLVVVTGTVTAKDGSDTLWFDDGSGPVRAFLDGYNGTWADIGVGSPVKVAGLASEDGLGHRIRVRNHGMHPHLPDDVQLLLYTIHLPVVTKNY